MPDHPFCCMNSCRSFWIFTWNRNSTWSKDSHYEMLRNEATQVLYEYSIELLLCAFGTNWSEISRNSLQIHSKLYTKSTEPKTLPKIMMVEFCILCRYFSFFLHEMPQKYWFYSKQNKNGFFSSHFSQIESKEKHNKLVFTIYYG